MLADIIFAETILHVAISALKDRGDDNLAAELEKVRRFLTELRSEQNADDSRFNQAER